MLFIPGIMLRCIKWHALLALESLPFKSHFLKKMEFHRISLLGISYTDFFKSSDYRRLFRLSMTISPTADA